MQQRLWSRLNSDDGFTLMEIVVAMVIIAVVVVTLVGLQITSLKTVAVARQRQAATALADQKLERLRALPYSTIQAGLLSTDSTLAGDAHVSSGQLTAPWNESLVTSSTQNEPELVPHTQTYTLNNINYSVSAYITHPTDDANSAVDFWLTVIVKWSSSSAGSHAKQVFVRTRAAYPAGCKGLGSANHPYAGPCQPFLYGNAGRTGASITITPAVSGSSPIPGLAFTNAAIVFSDYSAQIGVEQTTSALAKAVNSGTNVDGTVTDESSTSAAADIDPGTATATGPYNNPVPTTAAASSQISGSPGTLTLNRVGTGTGSYVQAAIAATASGNCQDLSGTVLASNQACAAAQMARAGSNEADLDLAAIGGRDLPAFALALMTPDTNPARTYAARLLAAYNGHCTGVGTDGCAAAGSQRTVTSLVVGALPSASQAGDNVPSGFQGMVTSTGLTESATAEMGQGSTSPLTNSSATRTGNLSYWGADGQYHSAALTTTSTINLGAVTATYAQNGNPQITIAMSGTLKVTAPSTTPNTATVCQPTACTTKANGGAIIADVTYQITSAGNQIANFTVELNLGAVLANATYRAVPSA